MEASYKDEDISLNSLSLQYLQYGVKRSVMYQNPQTHVTLEPTECAISDSVLYSEEGVCKIITV